MHPGTLRALEFDQIVEVLRGLSLTALGDARLAALVPQVELRVVESMLATTTEMVRFLADHPGLPLRAPDDIDDTLTALAVEGRPLEPVRLTGLVGFLESIDQTAHAIRRTARGSFELLRAVIAPLTSFDREIGDVRRAIDPSGELFDHASPELRAIRDRLRRQRSRLRSTLESYLRGKDTSRYLQDQVITDRNGRYVIVVRAEHRGSIPGIIHGSSSSGASLFLEPLSTVEINNEVVALTEQEHEEVLRILLALTDGFRARAEDLQRGLSVATDLDVVQARARFSKLVDGVPPTLSADGGLTLRAARHPLLLPAIDARLRDRLDQDSGEERPRRMAEPVPVDILITPPTSALVITGPNTGGKTVAIKTAGLAALMAQSGLHIPAAPGSCLPVFRTIFADIGDEQSIAANLSTFSWHVTNIAAMDRSLALPALVLLDEVGAGTDPIEGGALGMAVIEHFRQRGAIVLASTHYDTLKTYASTTPGVESAAFGFTPDTFEPTYRLVYGSPGRSLALEIASRLGLAASIVDAARAARTAREAQLAQHLAKVDEEAHALEHERRLVARERETIADDMARFRQREEGLRQREDEFRRRLDARLDDRLRDARREIDAVVEDLKRRAAALDSQASRRAMAGQAALSTGEAGAARSEARTALDQLEARLRVDVAGNAPTTRTEAPVEDGRVPVPGDRVRVGGLGLEGIVQWVQDREAEIDVRGKRLRAALEDVRLVGGPAAPPARVSVSVQAVTRDTASDLNVIGCSVDEALARADKFLDEALLGEQRTIRLIHGHGTGQLRRRIAEFLHDHPLVARYAAAAPDQGGSGVTVVELKD